LTVPRGAATLSGAPAKALSFLADDAVKAEAVAAPWPPQTMLVSFAERGERS
jgi:hypothetical protein